MIYLIINQLTGSVPPSLLGLPLLSRVSVAANNLEGPLPGFNSASLTTVILDNNLFHGIIPNELCHVVQSPTNGSVSILGNPFVTCYHDCFVGRTSISLIVDPRVVFCAPSSEPTSMPTSPTSRPTSHATKNQPIVASATTVSIESIIGAIVGSIVGVGVIAMILVWFIRDRRRRMKYKNLPIHRSIVHGEPLSASFVKEHLKSSYCFDDDGKTAFDLMCISLKMSWDIIEIWVLNDLPNLKGGDNQSTATGGDVESTRLSKSYIGLDVEQGSDDDPLMNATPMRSYAGYSWYLLVQQQSVEAQSLVSKVLDANPHYISALVNGYDNLKRRFVDVASPICRAIMERSLCLFKRFKPTSDTFAYKSPTSILLFAYDIDGDTKVALKFIQSRVLFDRELDSRRSAGFSRDFVIDVLVSYDEISDAEWTRCCDICPFLADNAASHYCLVLEAGGNNLGVQLLNSTSATKDWIAISRIFRDIIRCVIHVHERGQIHGDLKLKNIVTMDTKVVTNGPTPTLAAGSQIRLIDFDASAPIYGARLMDKVSTAYAAPELFVLDESNGGVMLAPGERTKVLATTAQDVWAVGCILYHLATDNTLFHASDKDMIVSSNDRVALRDWDDSFKAQKLTQVGNGAARRLLYKMLEKDPLKRIAATDILNDLFVKSGYNDTIQAFNIFLSYRVSSDAEHVEKIYEKLSALSMKCWWDRKCLRAGESKLHIQ